MKRITILSIFYYFLSQNAYSLVDVEELMWKNRVILVEGVKNLETVTSILENWEKEIRERDIYWFVFSEKLVFTNYSKDLDSSFYKNTVEKYFENRKVKVILLGKDGAVKATQENIELDSLFDLIDAMPMRQLEMAK